MPLAAGVSAAMIAYRAKLSYPATVAVHRRGMGLGGEPARPSGGGLNMAKKNGRVKGKIWEISDLDRSDVYLIFVVWNLWAQ